MSDIHEIKRELASRALSVCERLLPGGRKDGAEFKAGSVSGEAGNSLSVSLTGSKAGVWRDFAESDKGGDLLDLWQQSQGISLVQALDEARDFLGWEKPKFVGQKREWTRPEAPKGTTKVKDRVRDYLTEDRCIPDQILEKYKVAAKGNEIVFPFIADGVLRMIKTRTAEDGGKPKPTGPNQECVLFGWQAIPDDAREVTITEGEIDALSMAAYGYPALSVPFGGGDGEKQKWVENDYDRLERFETIFLALDDDEQGHAAVNELVNRLGAHRCRIVTLPRKDANECRMSGISEAEIHQAIKAATYRAPETLRCASEYTDSVVSLFWPKEGQHIGYKLPYVGMETKLLFRPSEVTVWTGASGSGKSQILSDCSVDWIKQGSRLCVASLEMAPAQTLKRMAKQAGNMDRPTTEFLHAIMSWLGDGLYLYDRVGKCELESLLTVFDYARKRYGCDQFIIDSLMRLGVETDDYNSQEAVMYRVVDWAIEREVHVHFVCHSRKGEKEQGPQGIEDVKGAMEIGANAFNIVSVWRNRKQEDEIKAADTDELRDALSKKPGVILNVPKQRNGDWEGKCGLSFNLETYQYRTSRCDRWGRTYLSLGEVRAAE